MPRCARLDASRTNATNHGPGLLRATVLKQAPCTKARSSSSRQTSPDEIADAAVFLLDGSDASHGNFFGADGGSGLDRISAGPGESDYG